MVDVVEIVRCFYDSRLQLDASHMFKGELLDRTKGNSTAQADHEAVVGLLAQEQGHAAYQYLGRQVAGGRGIRLSINFEYAIVALALNDNCGAYALFVEGRLALPFLREVIEELLMAGFCDLRSIPVDPA